MEKLLNESFKQMGPSSRNRKREISENRKRIRRIRIEILWIGKEKRGVRESKEIVKD